MANKRGTIRRRELLTGFALAAVALIRPRGFQGTARAEASTTGSIPRYWVNIVPMGGIDAVWTTDPKTRAQVKPSVDVPYGANEIVEANGIRLGPHFQPLAAVASDLTIVNGVLVRTANHNSGFEHSTRLRTATTTRTPAAFEIIGAHRDGQPMAHVCLNSPVRQTHTMSYFGTAADGDFGGGPSVLDLIDGLEPAELHELAQILDAKVRSLRRQGRLSDREKVGVDNISQVRAYLARVADAPKLQKPAADSTRPADPVSGMLREQLNRVVWLLQNDLTATVTMFLGSSALWDSHFNNTTVQTTLNPRLAQTLKEFIESLKTTSNRYGRLLDQTGVIVASEIGRHPYINAVLGKDHFPQVPVIFAGAPFVAGKQFGTTGREMEATGDRLVLDDVGHTILRLSGLNPRTYAFPGRELGFVRAS